METVIEKGSEALLRMSWQAAVLVCLVLLVQWVFRRHLAPRWRYALWLLVVGRLLLPVMPASPLSIFNLAPQPGPPPVEAVDPPASPSPASGTEMAAALPGVTEPQASEESWLMPPLEPAPESSPAAVSPENLSPAPPLPTEAAQSAVPWILGIWVAGILFLIVRVLLASLRLRKIVSDLEGITEGPAADLLQSCQTEMGVQRPVQLLESPEITTPALYGFFTPRLLLPSGLKDRFTTQELRFVFLHELAHVKRHDIAMNWVLTALHILHWFNPFVWLAFGRMRADRELACDAMALACAGEQESRSYGATVVKLVEEFSRAAAVPSMAGILEDKTQIEQRLQMIVGFRRNARWPVMAILVMAALGLATLTDAQFERVSSDPNPFIPLNLKPVFTTFEMADWVNMEGCFAVVPRGRTNLGGIEFQADGLIQLLGKGPQEEGRRYRERVTLPLPTNRFAAIHILGGMGWMGALHGTTVAELVLTYAGGATARLPIQAGVHMKDWFRMRYEDPLTVSHPDSRVAWRGTHPITQGWGKSLRLWCTSLDNPHRDKQVTKLELVSAMARPNLFVTAITLDSRSFDERPFPAPDLDLDEPPMTGRLTLTFVDSVTGQPIPGVEVLSSGSEWVGTSNYAIYKKEVQSDSAGVALLPVSENHLDKLDVRVTRKGYTGWRKRWDSVQSEPIPEALTIPLQPGALIGGTVFDAYNTPLAKVEVSIARIWRGGESAADRNNPARFTTTKTTTDALGQWSTRNVPHSVLDTIRLQFSHPDFAQTNQMPEGDMTQLLKDRTWRTVLLQGAQVSGVVLDEAGRPVQDATVTFGRRYFANRQETKTDEAGQFILSNLALANPRVNEVLTVQADHFAPNVKNLEFPPSGEAIQFILTPGATIRGKVVDEAGNPLPRVRVSLESPHFGNEAAIAWSSETDSEGRFEWNGAPPDEIQSFYFGRGGYGQLRDVKLKPGAEEQIITLPNTRTLSGRVTDSRTGQAVPRFAVLPASGDAERLYSWSDSDQREFQAADGAFELELTEEKHSVVRISAEGYLMQNVVLPPATNHQISITASLEPVAVVEGYVVDPAGEPVPGAEVVLTGSDNFFYFRLANSEFESHQANAPKTVSDASGHFRLTPSMQPDGLAVVNENGFGDITMAEFQRTGLIVLQPWGRIEGRVLIGTEPGAGIEVLLRTTPSGGMHSTLQLDFQKYKATTDANGEFVIEKAPPGRRSIVRLLKQTPTSWSHTHPVNIEVAAGQTTRVQMGGDGVMVRGRAVGEGVSFNFTDYELRGSLATRLPSPREKEDYQAWTQTAEAKALFATVKSFAFKVQSDGNFEIPDVPPGDYHLNIRVHEKSEGGLPSAGIPIESMREDVAIPDGAAAGTIHHLGSFSVKVPAGD